MSDPPNHMRLVRRADNVLALCDAETPPERGVTPCFDDLLRRLTPAGLPKRDPLRRAFGERVGMIADATAGLGRDAFLLAMSGFRVIAVERSLLLFPLLAEELDRIRTNPAVNLRLDGRIELRQGDARAILPTLRPPPDAVYLDPMFPYKSKSALSKKSIRLVRAAVGDDLDAASLFRIASGVARERVVVKRSDDAPPLAPHPSFAIRSKLVRYDVYMTSRRDGHDA